MKISKTYFATFAVLLAVLAISLVQCTSEQHETKPMSQGDMIIRGKYLVVVGGCHDCHSPKVFTAHGPEDDTTRLLSGRPAEMGIPTFDPALVGPGKYIMASQDLTAWAGPWGISFPFNITPDSITGIGAWTEETFMKALRSGKHMGTDAGRPILPPMPWFNYAKMTDDDLKSVYAYLRTLPPINNKVPDPIDFAEIGKSNM
jgi:mono/diheme cytochrome c family protein